MLFHRHLLAEYSQSREQEKKSQLLHGEAQSEPPLALAVNGEETYVKQVMLSLWIQPAKREKFGQLFPCLNRSGVGFSFGSINTVAR